MTKAIRRPSWPAVCVAGLLAAPLIVIGISLLHMPHYPSLEPPLDLMQAYVVSLYGAGYVLLGAMVLAMLFGRAMSMGVFLMLANFCVLEASGVLVNTASQQSGTGMWLPTVFEFVAG